MSALEETNYLQAVFVPDEIGWPVMSFLFGADYVISNVLTPSREQVDALEAAEFSHFHFMIVDRTTNTLMKNRLMGVMPEIKLQIIKELRRNSRGTSAEEALKLGSEIPTVDRFAIGRCWAYSKAEQIFVDVPNEDVRYILK